MCLYSWQKRKKSSKDIICYKVFICDKDGNNLTSRYRDAFKWIIGKLTKAERAKAGCIKRDGEITTGYFHSYEKAKEAIESILSPELYHERGKSLLVYECIIPAGSYYYYGIHSDGREGYASKELIVVKCV